MGGSDQGNVYDFGKRADRRREVGRILKALRSVLAAEELYRDNMPENFQTSDRYDDACDAAEGLEEAISLLECVY